MNNEATQLSQKKFQVFKNVSLDPRAIAVGNFSNYSFCYDTKHKAIFIWSFLSSKKAFFSNRRYLRYNYKSVESSFKRMSS